MGSWLSSSWRIPSHKFHVVVTLMRTVTTQCLRSLCPCGYRPRSAIDQPLHTHHMKEQLGRREGKGQARRRSVWRRCSWRNPSAWSATSTESLFGTFSISSFTTCTQHGCACLTIRGCVRQYQQWKQLEP